MTQLSIDYSDICDAVQRLNGVARWTPLLTSAVLDDLTKSRVYIKPEGLQRSGAFKFRGAYNRLATLSTSERKRGVVAFSSGNHAQAVAKVARLLGISAVIVLPSDAPPMKIARTEREGARLVFYDRALDTAQGGGRREAIAREIAEAEERVLVPSYDDSYIIAGQGTVGYEIAQDMAAMGVAPDICAVPIGGGGLIAGVGTALRAAFPRVALIGVEPQGYDDTRLSLAAGRRVAVAVGAGGARSASERERKASAICDALLTPLPGKLTFAINRAHAVEVAVVDALAVRQAMRFAFEELKLVVEAGGAVALAALLSGAIDARGKTIALVLSGSNVDGATFAELALR